MINIFVELLESLGVGICLILAAPLSFFKRLDHFFQLFEYMPYLLRSGLFAALLRARLDYKMGNYQQAVVILGPIVNELERAIKTDRNAPLRIKRLLCTLYCDIQQLSLLSGQIEDAAQIVIRAQQHLGLDRLPSNPDLDLKTAHVVKAGLAASKMLEEGGLATLMVRQGEEPVVTSPQKSLKTPRNKAKKDDGMATIIQFPVRIP